MVAAQPLDRLGKWWQPDLGPAGVEVAKVSDRVGFEAPVRGEPVLGAVLTGPRLVVHPL